MQTLSLGASSKPSTLTRTCATVCGSFDRRSDVINSSSSPHYSVDRCGVLSVSPWNISNNLWWRREIGVARIDSHQWFNCMEMDRRQNPSAQIPHRRMSLRGMTLESWTVAERPDIRVYDLSLVGAANSSNKLCCLGLPAPSTHSEAELCIRRIPYRVRLNLELSSNFNCRQT